MCLGSEAVLQNIKLFTKLFWNCSLRVWGLQHLVRELLHMQMQRVSKTMDIPMLGLKPIQLFRFFQACARYLQMQTNPISLVNSSIQLSLLQQKKTAKQTHFPTVFRKVYFVCFLFFRANSCYLTRRNSYDTGGYWFHNTIWYTGGTALYELFNWKQQLANLLIQPGKCLI